MVKYLAAYALVQLSGKAPTKDAVKAVLKAGGVAIDEARINELFSNLEGKDFNKVVADGLAKVSKAGPVAGGAAAAAPAPAAAAKKEEPKKEDKKAAKAPEPEDDDDMIGGLF